MIPPPYSRMETSLPSGVSSTQQNPQILMSSNALPAGQAYLVNQPPQAGYANGCTQIVYSCSPAPVVYSQYKAGQSKFLGISQIIIGILCIVFNGGALGAVSNYGYGLGDLSPIGHGFWGGVFFIITGSFGIPAAVKKSRGFIITFMILCILSAVLAGIILMLGIASLYWVAVVECPDYFYYMDENENRYRYNEDDCSDGYSAKLAIHSILVILFVLEGVCTIWGSILGCKVACCGAKSKTPYNSQPQPVIVGSVTGNQQGIVLTTPSPITGPAYPAGFPLATPNIYQALQPATLNTGNLNTASEGKVNLALE